MIDTFSGIGGFSLAARWLGGIETVQFVEREPYCQRILAKHWPTVPIHDDICTFNPAPGSADIVCGGFPCQDISTAGKQAGIKEGTRSGLFYELMRVIRLVGPRYVVLENVAAITSNGMDAVLGTLAEAGFDAEWACIPAADVGACHRRDRWWCVAYAPHLLSDGQQIGHAGESGVSAVSEFGDGCGAGDAADASGSGSSDRLPTGISAMGKKGGNGMEPKFQRHCAEPPHPHHQRQQKRQPPAIAGGEGWAGWGDAPRRLNPNWRSYLSKPVLCRGDDGLSGRVDRLRALGNAVVPQVAMIPLARVLGLSRSA
jgi:DNA (cytosine-5)-methyltransferase 1